MTGYREGWEHALGIFECVDRMGRTSWELLVSVQLNLAKDPKQTNQIVQVWKRRLLLISEEIYYQDLLGQVSHFSSCKDTKNQAGYQAGPRKEALILPAN